MARNQNDDESASQLNFFKFMGLSGNLEGSTSPASGNNRFHHSVPNPPPSTGSSFSTNCASSRLQMDEQGDPNGDGKSDLISKLKSKIHSLEKINEELQMKIGRVKGRQENPDSGASSTIEKSGEEIKVLAGAVSNLTDKVSFLWAKFNLHSGRINILNNNFNALDDDYSRFATAGGNAGCAEKINEIRKMVEEMESTVNGDMNLANRQEETSHQVHVRTGAAVRVSDVTCDDHPKEVRCNVSESRAALEEEMPSAMPMMDKDDTSSQSNSSPVEETSPAPSLPSGRPVCSLARGGRRRGFKSKHAEARRKACDSDPKLQSGIPTVSIRPRPPTNCKNKNERSGVSAGGGRLEMPRRRSSRLENKLVSYYQ